MVATHNLYLVALSVLISILAAYAARDLSERVRDARGRGWLALWLAGGATADGIGIWSMNYTGRLALRLPVPLLFDWPTVLLSLLVGILGSAGALLVLSRGQIGWPRVLAASIFLGGVGISGLHYTAMAAMRLPGLHPHYDSPALVTLSVVLAVALSFAALSLMFLARDGARGPRLRSHGSVLLRGAANPVMHYTAMAAVVFTLSDEVPNLSHAVSIESLCIVGISLVPVMVLVVALLISLVDRVEKQRALLDELFEQAPQAVALLRADNRIVRVNREFTGTFGYGPHEALGRRLGDLIVPDESRDEEQKYAELGAHGQRLDVEGVCRRKDGSRLHVSMVRVPVSVAGGQVEIYAIYRDVTERKRADEALRECADRLQALSRRLLQVQEEERRHLARELHDEVCQLLAAIVFHLHAATRVTGAAALARVEECARLVRQAGEQVRGLALELRPAMLDVLGLEAALHWLAERHQQRTGCEVRVEGHLPGKPLPPDLAITCFRVAQEALTNVVRHAQARHVWIEMGGAEGALELAVRDDGVGFDMGAAQRRAAEQDSLGLLGMAERVQLLGGRLRVESQPGRGAHIRATFPLSAGPDNPAGPAD
ncbi:MAG TPA: MHYT domain-containing protein [Gemmataceae bacterium]|nr:MHYT domain-containing protein [Gemmataceae bacterium]